MLVAFMFGVKAGYGLLVSFAVWKNNIYNLFLLHFEGQFYSLDFLSLKIIQLLCNLF